MDADIQFGELEETEPETHLRPDQNRHFCVAEVAELHDEDLPVFVDLDALRDMEDHALSDTSVELGGVMLGGQYQDAEGRPFVVITDSLRAQHYESTKGSFKFTHDTWQEITRQRDEFPDEIQMVGWYHTHPDWGVFLSGMDMFICDHFFNRTLDIALVIDPCRDDRGFFQWTGEIHERVRRTGGFYLMASRFRQYEVNEYASYLEGKYAMSGDPRLRSGGYGAPVVNIAEGRQTWQTVAVLGSLAIQFCFLLLITWRMMGPETFGVAPRETQEQIAALEKNAESEDAIRRKAAEVDAKIAALDQAMSQFDGGPKRLVGTLVEKSREVEELRAAVRGHLSLENELDSDISRLKVDLESSLLRGERLDENLTRLELTYGKLRKKSTLQEDQIAALEKKIAAYEDPESTEDDDTIWRWAYAGIGAAAVVLAAGCGVTALMRRKKQELDFEEEAEEEGEEANNS